MRSLVRLSQSQGAFRINRKTDHSEMTWKYQFIMVGLLRLCKGNDPVNVARDKPTAMSSVYLGSSPQAAVDGYVNTSSTSACSLTNPTDTTPWWILDLQGTYRVDTVSITSLKEPPFWLHSFFIELFSQNPQKCADAVPEAAVTRNVSRVLNPLVC
ncbi:uncharacterized protein LOC121379433 [Gigantopelta aegis]|uniref:uncharacterized protein LOC121379433 n=1 Tax=Gigantopelta aegis TaxID=1735272 RepID=UPI001B88DB21|nr:uncharacterized protein LOC121379433 [Gigantopelta aegis]